MQALPPQETGYSVASGSIQLNRARGIEVTQSRCCHPGWSLIVSSPSPSLEEPFPGPARRPGGGEGSAPVGAYNPTAIPAASNDRADLYIPGHSQAQGRAVQDE